MPHSHAHAGEHHDHHHDHTHAHGAARVRVPERVVSAMLLSAPARLGVAAGLVVLLWALVAWAMN